MGKVAGCPFSLPMGLWGRGENSGMHFCVTLDLLSRVRGAMEWTFLQSLQRSNKPNFNQIGDTWVVFWCFVVVGETNHQDV